LHLSVFYNNNVHHGNIILLWLLMDRNSLCNSHVLFHDYL
jgi:hypothetical protein